MRISDWSSDVCSSDLDRDVTHLPPAERRIAMVFQSYALFPHLTVAENIVFGLKVRRLPRAERDARLKRVADLVGLEPYLGRRQIGRASCGETVCTSG